MTKEKISGLNAFVNNKEEVKNILNDPSKKKQLEDFMSKQIDTTPISKIRLDESVDKISRLQHAFRAPIKKLLDASEWAVAERIPKDDSVNLSRTEDIINKLKELLSNDSVPFSNSYEYVEKPVVKPEDISKPETDKVVKPAAKEVLALNKAKETLALKEAKSPLAIAQKSQSKILLDTIEAEVDNAKKGLKKDKKEISDIPELSYLLKPLENVINSGSVDDIADLIRLIQRDIEMTSGYVVSTGLKSKLSHSEIRSITLKILHDSIYLNICNKMHELAARIMQRGVISEDINTLKKLNESYGIQNTSSPWHKRAIDIYSMFLRYISGQRLR